jgi:hypothetical protein
MVFSSEIDVCRAVDSANIAGRLREIHAPHSSADAAEAVDVAYTSPGDMARKLLEVHRLWWNIPSNSVPSS